GGRGFDLTGQRFGTLIARRLLPEHDRESRRVWRCKCDCGKLKDVSAHHLRNGSVKSCGSYPCTGRRGRPFTKTGTLAEYRAKEDQFVDGRWWYASRKGRRYLTCSETVLRS